MRRTMFLLFALTIVASASKGLASTDCEKWLAEYKQELAHKATVQHALAAKQRARNYAKRRVARLISPTAAPVPHPVRVSSMRPHLTPAQMLKRFDLLCGDLPVEPTNQVLDSRMAPDEFISEVSMGGPVDTDLLPPEGTLLSTEDVPPYSPPGVTSGGSPNQPVWPIYGPQPSGGFSAPVVPPAPVSSPVPEPSSMLLSLTGAAGAAGSLWRRRRAVAADL